MGKLATYIILMSGLMLLFYFGGLIRECDDDGLCRGTTANSRLLDLLLKPEDMPDTEISEDEEETATSNTFLILEGVVAAGLVIGLFWAGRPDLALVAPLAIFLFNLLWDFLKVFNVLWRVNSTLAILIFSPSLLLFIVTIVEWWRGRD